jgi:hypothetical protein
MVMLARGEESPGIGKGRDDASWVDVNPTEPKNEEKSMLSIYLLQMDGEYLK